MHIFDVGLRSGKSAGGEAVPATSSMFFFVPICPTLCLNAFGEGNIRLLQPLSVYGSKLPIQPTEAQRSLAQK